MGRAGKSPPVSTQSSQPRSGKWQTCGKALSGQESRNGKFAYCVYQSLMKLGSGACDAPRLNARKFEGMIIEQIRVNILTESNIRALAKLVDEEMDGVAREQRQKLETIEAELEEVKRKLARIWQFVKSTDIEMADAAQEASAELADRRGMLDSADTIAAFAEEMSDFLKTSELTETRAFVRSFVKEVQVKPGLAAIIYTIPISQSTHNTKLLLGGGFGRN